MGPPRTSFTCPPFPRFPKPADPVIPYLLDELRDLFAVMSQFVQQGAK